MYESMIVFKDVRAYDSFTGDMCLARDNIFVEAEERVSSPIFTLMVPSSEEERRKAKDMIGMPREASSPPKYSSTYKFGVTQPIGKRTRKGPAQ